MISTSVHGQQRLNNCSHPETDQGPASHPPVPGLTGVTTTAGSSSESLSFLALIVFSPLPMALVASGLDSADHHLTTEHVMGHCGQHKAPLVT